jgi:hypothetical protein
MSKQGLPTPEEFKKSMVLPLLCLITGLSEEKLTKDYEEFYSENAKEEKEKTTEKSNEGYTLLELLDVLKPGLVAVTTIDDELVEATIDEYGDLVYADDIDELFPINSDTANAVYKLKLKEQQRYPVSYSTAFEAYKNGEIVEVEYDGAVYRFVPGISTNPMITIEGILDGTWYVVK